MHLFTPVLDFEKSTEQNLVIDQTWATEERKGKGGKGGKGKWKMVVSSVDGAEDFTFTATCQDSKVESITC